MKKVVFIAGATSSGKTNFAHNLIDRFFTSSSIMSMDSVQIYKYMDIGSAKPSKEEIIKYHYSMVDIRSPLKNFSVKDYIELSAKYINEAVEPLFIVGGTGLYMNALKNGLFEENVDEDKTTRNFLNVELEKNGLNYLYEKLKEIDNETSLEIDKHNPRRVIRALEVYYNTGKKFSEIKKQRKPKVEIDYLSYIINPDRDILYKNIDTRVDKMFDNGLIDEVKYLIDIGINESMTSALAIGYKETIEYLNKKNMSEIELRDKIKLNTKHYAKRQVTWFKKEGGNFIDIYDKEIYSKVAEEIEEFLEKKV